MLTWFTCDCVYLLRRQCLMSYQYESVCLVRRPSEQTHTVTRQSCNTITDNSCMVFPCWYPFWYIHCIHISSPLLYHLLPCMHPLPFPSLPSPRLPYPILPSLSLLSLPLLSPTLPSHPSSQLSSILLPSPTQPSNTLSYPSLAPPPLHCPIIPSPH